MHMTLVNILHKEEPHQYVLFPKSITQEKDTCSKEQGTKKGGEKKPWAEQQARVASGKSHSGTKSRI